jgi:MerR family transcriptional regulator, copper efflux regulator
VKIGELAKLAQVTTRTIRYYEQLGLLGRAERDESGYRSYDEQVLDRLKKIDVLKGIGLSLEEIASVIDLYFEDATGINGKRKVLEILEGHYQETVQKITGLNQFKQELEANIAYVKNLIEAIEAE